MRAAAGRCSRELTSDECYQRLSSLGLQYGSGFRGIERLLVGAREAVGELRCPSAGPGSYRVQPNLLDSGLQVLAVLASLESAGAGPLLPAVIRSIRVARALKDAAACHVTLDEGGADGTRVGQVRLYDGEGALAVDVEGLMLRPAGEALTSRGWARERVYAVAWEPRTTGVVSPAGKTWLWITGAEADARAVAGALGSLGRADPVAAWPPGGAPKLIAARPGLEPPASGTAWEGLLDHSGAERAVWLTSALEPQDVAAECERVLDLCRSAVRSRASKLMLATFGAHDPAAPEPPQASLWGLFRTFAREHPDRWGGLLDLPPSFRADAPRAVSLALEGADAELALRGGALHEPRLSRPALPAAADPSFRPDATYVVTGGLGGVGLALARWLQERGAAHLLLLGRSAPSAEAERAVRALEERGAKVRVLQGDVANVEDVERALREPAARGWPEIKGVFHLAGALSDAVIQSLDGPRLRTAMAAKVSGGWNLHRATGSVSLDHFVLFSSIAALGTPGQGGHAAANAFLDALAHRRRAGGLPALSLGFGGFAEVGAAARYQAQGGRGAPGVEAMPPGRALDAMGALLAAPQPHAIISSTSWAAFAGGIAPGADRLYARLLERPVEPVAAAEPAAAAHLPTLLRAQPRQARIEALEDHIKEQIAGLLGLPLSSVPGRDVPLMQGGVDSLMSVQLRNMLRASLDVELSATVMFDNPTIGHLAEHLADLLETGGDQAAESNLESMEKILREIEQLPEGEAEARLRKGR
ncbi:MAG TPA: type I polyketide synthase [Myxococcaceae bacterium]